jgi:hypothetical protein
MFRSTDRLMGLTKVLDLILGMSGPELDMSGGGFCVCPDSFRGNNAALEMNQLSVAKYKSQTSF